MHEPIAKTGKWLRYMLNRPYRYHAVSGNIPVLKLFRI